MKFKFLATFLILFFASINSLARDRNFQTLEPEQAIRQAKWKYPNGIWANYRFIVRGIGKVKGVIYLNSELDYRDEKCLTVEIRFAIADQFQEKYGDIVGKEILVTGIARRTEIFFENTDALSYFQTHVYVHDLKQIRVIDNG